MVPPLHRWVRRHGRFTAAFATVLGVLVTVNVLREYGTAGAGLVAGPVVAVLLVLLARRSGLTWADLGLSRRRWARGVVLTAVAVVVVAAVYAVGALLPPTRQAFLDARYQLPAGQALVTALVVIPFGTVLVEEIAFRGVLQGLLTRYGGTGWGLGVSSALVGAWHVLPSLGLTRVNPAVADLAGSGLGGRVLAVLGAVLFTAVAGLLLAELRRRSGSLLAAAGLHWAVNGVGVLFAALLHAASS